VNARVASEGRRGTRATGLAILPKARLQPSLCRINNFGPVAPLQVTANRWDRKNLHVEGDSREQVERKVKGLLNRLSIEKFDSISDQTIISWANKLENEKDGRTLIQVIKLVFEKATDEATWSEMYARLCRKMMEQISPKLQDDGIKTNEGKPITGGQLFCEYLLNRF
jgi:translation initiation factor 4G